MLSPSHGQLALKTLDACHLPAPGAPASTNGSGEVSVSPKLEHGDIGSIPMTPPRLADAADLIEKLHVETWDACLRWQDKAKRLCEETVSARRAQLDQISFLLDELDKTQQNLDVVLVENESIKASMNRQKSENSNLVADILRVCDEKQQIYDQWEREKLEKEVCQLILDQYRDEIMEQKSTIEQKEGIIRDLTDLVTNIEGEVAELKVRCSFYQHCANANDFTIKELRQQLETQRISVERQKSGPEKPQQRVENMKGNLGTGLKSAEGLYLGQQSNAGTEAGPCATRKHRETESASRSRRRRRRRSRRSSASTI